MKKTIGNIAYIIISIILITAVLGQFGVLPFRTTYFLTGSMMPTYVPGDLAVFATKPQTLAVRDVVLFTTGGVPVIHRITAIEDGQITTQGDANNAPDPGTINTVDGKLLFSIPKLGYLIDYFHLGIQTVGRFLGAIFS
jgi:signal peptidase I